MSQILLFCFLKMDLEFKVCLLTSATGSSEGPGEAMEAQTVIKMLPTCSTISGTNRDPDIQDLMEDA